MIVALYARVSTDKQDEQLQLPRLREYAARKGLEVYREYSDKASGKNADRPGWMALESDARRGEFDAVVVVKLDRIMRSLSQMLEVFESFHNMGIEIITLDQGPMNLTSPMGKLQARLLAMLAEWEREIISERTKEGLAARRAKGVKLGRPKLDEFPTHTIALMRLEGRTWAEISKITSIPRTTINGRRKEIEKEMESIGIPEPPRLDNGLCGP